MIEEDDRVDCSTLLGRWVRNRVLPQLGAPSNAEIVRSSLPSSHRAVRCSVRVDGRETAAFTMKEYYRDPGVSRRESGVRARREMRAFRLVEACGLCEGAHRVARLLAGRATPPVALAVEHVQGHEVAHFLKRCATSSAAFGKSKEGLKGAAALLARFHGNRAPKIRVWRSGLRNYPYRLLHAIAADGVISEAQYTTMASTLSRFREMLADPSPRLVHGDANPTNFLVQPEGGVVAVDLERVGSCDPALDLGFLMADVVHLTRQYDGDTGLSRALVEVVRDAYETAHGAPFEVRHGLFLAVGFWRIARNRWLPLEHRRWLAALSRRLLRAACKGLPSQTELWLW